MDMTLPPAHLSATALAMIASPDVFSNPRRTRITRAVHGGQPIFFTVADRNDRIQARHAKGRFYEPEELKLIAQHFPRGGVFCDAGANIGNHSIYALKLLEASVSIPVRPEHTVYRADCDGDTRGAGWSPSIHMPRALSRIDLEIVSVRVERLQDISEADARAEGIVDGGCTECGNSEPCGCANPSPDARDSYCRLWGQINGPDAWAANHWVWVVEFRRLP